MRTMLLRMGVFFISLLFANQVLAGQSLTYGEILCGNTVEYTCLTVGTHTDTDQVATDQGPKLVEKTVADTWENLWPDPNERKIVQEINRLNIALAKGMKIAVPCDLQNKTLMDFSPYPLVIDPPGEKLLVWTPALLAWAVYDPTGNLVRWGAGVGGKDYCPDIKRSCRTKTGEFRIIRKAGANYRSSKYPVGCKGKSCAPMPFAMHFAENYAFHASTKVVGKHASHGCVRIFYDDAEWLNQHFVEKGTKVIIYPY